jgi:hypothetical protein
LFWIRNTPKLSRYFESASKDGDGKVFSIDLASANVTSIFMSILRSLAVKSAKKPVSSFLT